MCLEMMAGVRHRYVGLVLRSFSKWGEFFGAESADGY
jgi:hypothetical protein